MAVGTFDKAIFCVGWIIDLERIFAGVQSGAAIFVIQIGAVIWNDFRIKQEEINNNAWLQGMYVYDAVSTALHNALRGMGKSKPPAKDYAKQPYEFNNKVKSEAEKAKEVQIEQEKAAAWMENFVRMNQSQSHRARAK